MLYLYFIIWSVKILFQNNLNKAFKTVTLILFLITLLFSYTPFYGTYNLDTFRFRYFLNIFKHHTKKNAYKHMYLIKITFSFDWIKKNTYHDIEHETNENQCIQWVPFMYNYYKIRKCKYLPTHRVVFRREAKGGYSPGRLNYDGVFLINTI